MTSRFEGFGMVLLEAQINRLPIISFDVRCGPKDIIEDKKNGFLIPCFDNKFMVKKINELINNPEKRKDFSSNSQINLDKFKIEVITNQWIKLLSSF